jgi:recombination protein RecT
MANEVAIKDVQGEIMSPAMTQQLSLALPAHITVEKFQRVVVTALNKTPELLEGDRRTLYTACVECAQDGLLPNGKEAALVIFNSKDKLTGSWVKGVSYMPMIAGIYKRARNSGEIKMLSAHVVHKDDDFTYEYGFEPNLTHKPALGERGAIIAVYAIAVLKDGSRDMEVMSEKDVEEVRQASKAPDSGPWKGWWGEMAKKTAVRRLTKRLPMSSDLERVIQRVDDMYDYNGDAKDVTPAAPPPAPKRSDFAELEPPEETEPDSEEAPPPAEPEPQGKPTDDASPPALIEVGVLQEGGSDATADWTGWCESYLKEILACTSAAQVEGWQNANAAPLKNLGITLPDWLKKVERLSADHLITLG